MSQMQTMTQEQRVADEQRRLFDLAQQDEFEPEDGHSHDGETLTREDPGHSLGHGHEEEKEGMATSEISHGDPRAALMPEIPHGDTRAVPLSEISHGDPRIPHVPLSGPPLEPSAIGNPLPGQPTLLPAAIVSPLPGPPPVPPLPPEPAINPSPRQAFVDHAASALQAGFQHNPGNSHPPPAMRSPAYLLT